MRRSWVDQDESLEGERKENTPAHSMNLWTRYDFSPATPLQDLGVGLGVQYNSDQIPWFTRDFTIPEYAVVDMAVYYHPAKTNVQLALNVNNVLDNTYWMGAQNYLRLFPGAPRNFLLTATYKF